MWNEDEVYITNSDSGEECDKKCLKKNIKEWYKNTAVYLICVFMLIVAMLISETYKKKRKWKPSTSTQFFKYLFLFLLISQPVLTKNNKTVCFHPTSKKKRQSHSLPMRHKEDMVLILPFLKIC